MNFVVVGDFVFGVCWFLFVLVVVVVRVVWFLFVLVVVCVGVDFFPVAVNFFVFVGSAFVVFCDSLLFFFWCKLQTNIVIQIA